MRPKVPTRFKRRGAEQKPASESMSSPSTDPAEHGKRRMPRKLLIGLGGAAFVTIVLGTAKLEINHEQHEDAIAAAQAKQNKRLTAAANTEDNFRTLLLKYGGTCLQRTLVFRAGVKYWRSP